jgi:hypothetical protein
MVNTLISDLKKVNPPLGNDEPRNQQVINAKNSYIISLCYDFLGDKESAKKYHEAAVGKDYTIAFEVMYDAGYIPMER